MVADDRAGLAAPCPGHLLAERCVARTACPVPGGRLLLLVPLSAQEVVPAGLVPRRGSFPDQILGNVRQVPVHAPAQAQAPGLPRSAMESPGRPVSPPPRGLAAWPGNPEPADGSAG